MNKRFLPVFGILVGLVTTTLAADTLWTRRYDGPANGDEEACAVFTDGEDNVIVIGSSPTLTTGYDFVVFKYSPAGESLWLARIGSTGNTNDLVRAAKMDASGAIYLTGRTGSAGNYNILTVKLNPDGSEAWRAIYEGSGGKNDEPTAMAIDASGNVFITGYEADAGGYLDFVTIKYNADGTQAWAAKYDGGFGDDKGVDIALGPDGSVYVTGSRTQEGGTFQDYATLKYDAAGGQVWVDIYDRDTVNDIPTAIAVDSAGNVFVTGRSALGPGMGGPFSYVTLKYNSSGNRLWTKIYSGTNRGAIPVAMALTPNGLYITGNVWRTTNNDIGTVAYNPLTGSDLWVGVFNGVANKVDEASDILVDANGKIHIVGYSQDSLGRADYCRLRYSATGTLELVSLYNSPFDNADEGKAIAVDNQFNVVVTGRSYGGLPLMTYDIVTVKYDSSAPGISESDVKTRAFGTLKVQPNPARNRAILNLPLKAGEAATIALYDVAGALCHQEKVSLSGAGSTYSLNLAGFNPGVYILELKQGEGSSRVKLQVVK
ncbi:MAG: T9SS type A sorting domain-containing protein [candidate division WOR-3 bacterium]